MPSIFQDQEGKDLPKKEIKKEAKIILMSVYPELILDQSEHLRKLGIKSYPSFKGGPLL